MNTNNDMVSGFESENFDNFAQDAFNEALQSSIAVDVEICNYDLSCRTPIRAIIQGRVSDTKLNSLSRAVLTEIGTLKLGQYIFYKNRYWLIVGLIDDNGFYEKGIVALCNHLLTWVNQNEKIIQRWVNVSSASQYNNGETNNKFMFIRNDQLMIAMPQDEECLLIPHNQRFIIDMRCKIYEQQFSSDTTIETSKPLITYELTRMDNTIYNYQDSGHLEFIASQDEKHEKDGYYVIDGKGYWLCDIPSPTSDDKNKVLSCSIDYEEPVVYCGLEPSGFKCKFTDSNGEIVNISPKWEINCDFIDRLIIQYDNDTIFISTNDRKLINKSFELLLSADNYKRTSITIRISDFI